jgi:hypothetical protein
MFTFLDHNTRKTNVNDAMQDPNITATPPKYWYRQEEQASSKSYYEALNINAITIDMENECYTVPYDDYKKLNGGCRNIDGNNPSTRIGVSVNKGSLYDCK